MQVDPQLQDTFAGGLFLNEVLPVVVMILKVLKVIPWDIQGFMKHILGVHDSLNYF